MGTNSGGKNLVFNTRERAMSGDVNRMQAFHDAHLAELLKHWLLSILVDGGGVAVVPASTATPLFGVIAGGGLLVRPQTAGSNLVIDPGVAVICDPDAAPSADDSPVKTIVDPGTTLAGSFLANAGPGNRIDVVECARVTPARDGLGNVNSGALITETASRDIYNPATGLFTATVVNKVHRGGQFTYRVRRGVAGAGYPGHAAGWMPLMIAAVPTSATNWDGCVMYDVRPLLNDRTDAPALIQRERPRFASAIFTANWQIANTAPLLVSGMGVCESELGAMRAGGVIPGAGLNLDGDNVGETTGWAAAVTAGCWMLYAAFPHGLPRWMLYAGTPRLPNGFRGVTVASQTMCDERGRPNGALSMPVNTLLGAPAATTEAVLVAAGRSIGVGSARLYPAQGTGDWTYCPITDPVFRNATAAGSSFAVSLTPAAGHFPACAKEILLEIDMTLNGSLTAGTYDGYIEASTGTLPFHREERSQAINNAGPVGDRIITRIKVPVFGGPTQVVTIASNFMGQAGASSTNVAAYVVGWKI